MPTFNSTPTQYIDNDVINIQLPYDPNILTKPELWNGIFHSISLHGSLKHLASNTKNIKDSLNFVAKYISNKEIDSRKLNDIQDFKGISKAIWNLISSVYQSNWNSLTTDKNLYTVKQKISAKFTPKMKPIINENNSKSVPANIEKILSLISVKFLKKVNQISKYFKNLKIMALVVKPNSKMYA